ncbi:MAG: hypothetical protein AB8B96_16420 [Lysobacterales bacterium]
MFSIAPWLPRLIRRTTNGCVGILAITTLLVTTASAQFIIDSDGISGQFSAVTIGQDDLPIIAFQANNALKVIHCLTSDCSTSEVSDLSAIAPSALEISIAIRTDGRPLIALRSNSSVAVELVDCGDTVCSTASKRNLANSGRYPDIAIRDDGRPMIAFYRRSDSSAAVYDCSDDGCSDGTVRILDTAPSPSNALGTFPSIAIGSGLPIISYVEGFPNNRLKVFRCADVNCASGTATIAGSGANSYTQTVVPADGRPLISYYSGSDLRLLNCLDIDCTQTTQRTVDSGSVGAHLSMTLNANGVAVMSYSDSANRDLKSYLCNDIRCASGRPDRVDQTGDVGQFTSIALRPGEGPIISYSDDGNDDLKVYPCPDQGCAIQVFTDGFEAAPL